MTNYFYLASAYLVFWLVPFIFCLALAKKLKSCDNRLEALERSKSR